jgi:8-oxo-dGTP pyrophosphatase MutT (NUDIX family)
MAGTLKKAWTDFVQPILQRPKRVQVAALCYRETDGGKQILLISSRDTGRWILPKGWPIDGMDGPRAALQEAWEEAGVREAEIVTEPLGQYEYIKGMDSGGSVAVATQVYLARVKALSDRYPESDERHREWVTPRDAADRVDEPELQEILRNL